MRESTPNTIYFVWWPTARIMKVGYSDQSRWRVFEARGAEVLALKSFPTCREALDFELACHDALKSVCRPGFPSRELAKASGLLGATSGGWLECFKVPADLTAAELLDFCDLALDQLGRAA